MKGWTNNESLSVASVDAFDKMTLKAQSEYTDKMMSKYWKVKFK